MKTLSCFFCIVFLLGCDASRVEEALDERSAALTATVVVRRGTHAVADTFVSERAQRVNFGNRKVLRVTHKKEALLRFDLEEVPRHAVIESAKLTLFVHGQDEEDDDCPDQSDYPITFHRVKRAWAEPTVTYKSFDQRFDPDVEAMLQVTSHNTFKTVDIAPLVREWVSGQKPNHGLLLKTSGSTRAVFVSSEHRLENQRPRLEIVYTTPDDHCAPNPCENGGVCANGQDGFICECAPGFTGPTCEDPIERCSPNPCNNGGTCAQEGDAFTCACSAGWTGLTCEQNVDECAANPCLNGGVCTDGVGAFACVCPLGFEGDLCQTDIDDCAQAPCQNGATCTDLVSSFVCDCAPGFAGSYCEVDVDDCAAHACQNNATCIDGRNSYTCACAPGFTGLLCELNPNDCAADPCLNGGTCVDGLGGYTCNCAPGYEGGNCEVDIDDCADSPCVTGQCLDLVQGYECLCQENWIRQCDANGNVVWLDSCGAVSSVATVCSACEVCTNTSATEAVCSAAPPGHVWKNLDVPYVFNPQPGTITSTEVGPLNLACGARAVYASVGFYVSGWSLPVGSTVETSLQIKSGAGAWSTLPISGPHWLEEGSTQVILTGGDPLQVDRFSAHVPGWMLGNDVQFRLIATVTPIESNVHETSGVRQFFFGEIVPGNNLSMNQETVFFPSDAVAGGTTYTLMTNWEVPSGAGVTVSLESHVPGEGWVRFGPGNSHGTGSRTMVFSPTSHPSGTRAFRMSAMVTGSGSSLPEAVFSRASWSWIRKDVRVPVFQPGQSLEVNLHVAP